LSKKRQFFLQYFWRKYLKLIPCVTVQDSRKVNSGYLECQICGHLTPGFDRSKQRVHFHEEHPTEAVVNASKYVSKSRPALASGSGLEAKFDPSRYAGLAMACPKADCPFETKTLMAMNSHLRRHTQTFKCGHCGKAFPSSSDFHQVSIFRPKIFLTIF
jgi:hypothetical protein